MTSAEFIAKWQANTRTERAACQEQARHQNDFSWKEARISGA
jgi:hypothetical protein